MADYIVMKRINERGGTKTKKSYTCLGRGGKRLLDSVIQSSSTEIRVEDLRGAWVTPGLVDLHSHLGVYSAPMLSAEYVLISSTFYRNFLS